MKPSHKSWMTSLGLVAVLGMNVHAQTTWTGGDGATLKTASNWSSGLPSLSNPGTIPNGTLGIDFNVNPTNWIVTQNGGALTTSTFRQFNGGSWTMNGGSISLGNNFQLVTEDNQSHIFTVNAGASASTTSTLYVSSAGTNRSATLNIHGGSVSSNQFQVLNGGTVDFTGGSLANSGTMTINAGGIFSMSGGTRTGSGVANSGTLNISSGDFNTAENSNLTTNVGGTTTISGGNVSIGSSIGDSIRGTGAYVFTGGTTTMTGDIRADADTFSLTLGGNTAGSLTADGWHSSTTYRRTNWLPGSMMTFTLSSAEPFWAKTEWDADRLAFNGSTKSLLSNLAWEDATTPSKGLGGGYYWDYSSTTKTLALGYYSPLPEPTGALAGALLGIGPLNRRLPTGKGAVSRPSHGC